MQSSSEFLSPQDVSSQLRIPLGIVRAFISSGELPAIELNGEWLIRRDSVSRFSKDQSWQGLPRGIALVSLDELSELVMRKVAQRFGLEVHYFESGEQLLTVIQRGKCSVVVLGAEIAGASNDHTYAEIRSFCPALPVAVVSSKLPSHSFSRYLLRGGPVTFIDKPVLYHHAETMLSQFGFERQRREDLQES